MRDFGIFEILQLKPSELKLKIETSFQFRLEKWTCTDDPLNLKRETFSAYFEFLRNLDNLQSSLEKNYFFNNVRLDVNFWTK